MTLARASTPRHSRTAARLTVRSVARVTIGVETAFPSKGTGPPVRANNVMRNSSVTRSDSDWRAL